MNTYIKGYLTKESSLLSPEEQDEIISKYYAHADRAHDYDHHIEPVRRTAASIADKLRLSKKDREDLDTAALLHDITRDTDPDHHNISGAKEAIKLLLQKGIDKKRAKRIAEMIRLHRATIQLPRRINKPSMILRDSDRIAEPNPFKRAANYSLVKLTAGDEEAALKNAYNHMVNKFHPETGYGSLSLHLPESKELYSKYYQEATDAYENKGLEGLRELAEFKKTAMLDKDKVVQAANKLMGKEAYSYTATGKVQNVHLRKVLHKLLDEYNLPGQAVNDPFTGNVELTIGGKGKDDQEILEKLRQYVKDKGHNPPTFHKVRKRPVKEIALTEEDINKILPLHFLRYAMSAKDFPVGERWRAKAPDLASRYRLKEDNGIFRGMIPSRAARQLRGEELPYKVHYEPIRSTEEALSLMHEEDRNRVREVLGL